jgi:hypothetical protein
MAGDMMGVCCAEEKEDGYQTESFCGRCRDIVSRERRGLLIQKCEMRVVKGGGEKRRKFYKCAQRRLLRCFGHDQNLRVVSMSFHKIPRPHYA